MYNQYIVKQFVGKYWPLILIIGFHVGANILWLNLDRTPPAWDQAAHIRVAKLFFDWFGGSSRYPLVELVREAYGYPPLVQLLGALVTMLIGFSVVKLTILTTIFFAGLLLGMYKLTDYFLKNRNSSIFIVAVFSLFPAVYDTSRSFLLDIPLLTWTVWGFYFWLKSDYLRSRKYALLFGLVLSLASLTKLNGFLYFVPLGILNLWVMVREKGEHIWVNAILVLGMAGLLCGWWWVVNFRNIGLYLSGLASNGEPLTDPSNLMMLGTWLHYLRLMTNDQVFLIPMIVVLVLVGIGLIWGKIDRRLWFYLVFNYVVFTLIKNKDYRFTMPLLPVLAVMAGMGFDKLKNKWRAAGLTTMMCLLAFQGFLWINNSFSWPVGIRGNWGNLKTFVLGNVSLINLSEYPIRPVKGQIWPTRRAAIDAVAADGESSLSQDKTMLVLINVAQMNDNNIKMYRDIETAGQSYVVFGAGDRAAFASQAELEAFMLKYDLVLLPDREVDLTPFYVTGRQALIQARDYVWDNLGKYQILKDYDLPTGGRVHLIRKI